ncbi:hypothetical protein FACS189490_04680 [Clostridia bacterium]|nr:hypothetical protein FACS189490_04680 [Clostridia bacterium]
MRLRRLSIVLTAGLFFALTACGAKKEEEFIPPEQILSKITQSVIRMKDSDEAKAAFAETAEETRGLLTDAAVAYYGKADDYSAEELTSMVSALFVAIDSVIAYEVGEPGYANEKTAYVDVFVRTIDNAHFLQNCNDYLNKNYPDFNDFEPEIRTQLSVEAFLQSCRDVKVSEKSTRVAAKFLKYEKTGWVLQNVTDFKTKLFAAYVGS